jgi:hypothetical protein
MATEDDQAKKSERWPIAEEWRVKQQQHPKATFDILMAKYKEGRACIRGHENWTIWNTNLDNPISLGQTSTSTALSSAGKWPQTLMRQNSEGQNHHGALLPSQATNAWAVGTSTDQKVGIIVSKIIIRLLTSRSGHQCWAMGTSADDVPALSTLGRVVWTMGSTIDAFPPGMVRTY